MPFRIITNCFMVNNIRIVMNVNDPSIGYHIIFGRNSTRVITIDNCMDTMAINKTLHGRNNVICALVTCIFDHWLQRTPQNATQRINFIASHLLRALKLNTVGSCPSSHGHTSTQGDWIAICFGTIVNRTQHRAG